jgi:hypothetical protein
MAAQRSPKRKPRAVVGQSKPKPKPPKKKKPAKRKKSKSPLSRVAAK